MDGSILASVKLDATIQRCNFLLIYSWVRDTLWYVYYILVPNQTESNIIIMKSLQQYNAENTYSGALIIWTLLVIKDFSCSNTENVCCLSLEDWFLSLRWSTRSSSSGHWILYYPEILLKWTTTVHVASCMQKEYTVLVHMYVHLHYTIFIGLYVV